MKLLVYIIPSIPLFLWLIYYFVNGRNIEYWDDFWIDMSGRQWFIVAASLTTWALICGFMI